MADHLGLWFNREFRLESSELPPATWEPSYGRDRLGDLYVLGWSKPFLWHLCRIRRNRIKVIFEAGIGRLTSWARLQYRMDEHALLRQLRLRVSGSAETRIRHAKPSVFRLGGGRDHTFGWPHSYSRRRVGLWVEPNAISGISVYLRTIVGYEPVSDQRNAEAGCLIAAHAKGIDEVRDIARQRKIRLFSERIDEFSKYWEAAE